MQALGLALGDSDVRQAPELKPKLIIDCLYAEGYFSRHNKLQTCKAVDTKFHGLFIPATRCNPRVA
jgi:hypothetical protein